MYYNFFNLLKCFCIFYKNMKAHLFNYYKKTIIIRKNLQFTNLQINNLKTKYKKINEKKI